MLDRNKILGRFGVAATAGLWLFLAILLGLALITWLWPSPGDASAFDGPVWPHLLGGEIQAQAQGPVVEVGRVEGMVNLQGRADHSTVQIELDGIPPTTGPDASGAYTFEDVAPGKYVLNFTHPSYLSHGIYLNISSGQTTEATVELRGGDVDRNNVINLVDLAAIAGELGSTSVVDEDVNGDGVVNVRDLVLAGGNFFRRAELPVSRGQQRLDDLIQSLVEGPPGGVEAAIDAGMEILYGGLRPVISPDLADTGPAASQTQLAHQAISAKEMAFAEALRLASQRTDLDRGLAGRAVDLKLFVEEMNEVAEAVGQATSQCGMKVDDPQRGMDLRLPPCDQLTPLLNVDPVTGMPLHPCWPFLCPSFSVKLRGPTFPQPWALTWEEDVKLLGPIAPGACGNVVKETRGLMVRLHFDRITIVRDPWVSVFGVARGTRIPIWSIEWVPSEYVKTWEICNVVDSAGLPGTQTTVSQQVKQDIPLNFVWRFYGKDR